MHELSDNISILASFMINTRDVEWTMGMANIVIHSINDYQLVQEFGPGKVLKQQASTYLTKIFVIVGTFWPEVWSEGRAMSLSTELKTWEAVPTG